MQKSVIVERKEVCGTCKGSKIKSGTSPTKCLHCEGRGIVFSNKAQSLSKQLALSAKAWEQ